MKKKLLVLMLASMMVASCVACGNKSSDNKDKASSSATERVSDTKVAEDVEPIDVKVDDLKALADAGVITGVKDITVEEGKDVNLNKLVYADKDIVKSVDIDDSKVDYSKAGTYEVIYTITFDGDKFRDYVKEHNINVNFDTDGDTIVVKTTVTVTVATKEDAEKAIASGNTNVVTPETEKSIAESNKAKANDNAVASKPAEKPAKKPAGNTGNSNAGKHENNNNNGNSNSGNNNANAGNNGNSNNSNNGNHNENSNGNNGNHNGNNGSNNDNHNGNTEKPHVHNYNSGVVTKEPTCTDTGVKTYTCVDGDDSYTETIPALEHDYVTRTETVTIKEAWDEDVYEGFYICNGCGEKFEDTEDFIRHSIFARRENPDTTCKSYYEEDVKVNTIHHPAETETRTYKVCSRCGDTVK